jgi:hypothetical protein
MNNRETKGKTMFADGTLAPAQVLRYQCPSSLSFLARTDVERAPLRPSSIQRRLSGHASPPGEVKTMCPFCLAALGQVVAGVVSAGGFTALAVKLSRLGLFQKRKEK